MKKYLSILLVLVILFSFAACTKGTNKQIDPSSSNSASSLDSDSSGDTSSTLQNQPSSSESDQADSTQFGAASSSVKPSSTAPGSQASTPTVSASSQPPAAATVRIVIPEGFTLSQIGDRLEANGVCKKAALLSTANSYDFSYYSLISPLSAAANRAYKLEGYLFPDTYEFYKNMKPQDVLGKMLKNAQSQIGSKYSYSGMTADQIVVLASIIEKESGKAGELQKISSVFHNRLKAGMKLQADPTILYIESFVKPNLIGDINRYNSLYNTYKCPALPAGAICNPGVAALNAAANPTDTDYLYFCADKNGNYYYAKTLAEHDANLAKGGIVIGNSIQ
jgi:UPF0755 protein